MMPRRNIVSFLLSLMWLAGPLYGATPTTLPSVFSDHMVFQRDLPIAVWGLAEPGMAVSVNFGNAKVSAVADSSGKWSLRLPPIAASAIPRHMTVSDANGQVASFDDVLVGDVWVASGQSNMEFGLRSAHNAATELPRADHTTIRLFTVRRRSAEQPQFTCQGNWSACTPETAARFSAVAYFFAREIQQSQGVPIGLIGTYASGTKIEPWMSIEGFRAAPALRAFADELDRVTAELPELRKKYETEELPKWQAAHDAWDKEVGPAHREAMKQWNEASAAARAAGTPAPTRPQPARPEPRKPDPPKTNPRGLGGLYDAMVAPIVPFGIKGVIWYQGESNADKPEQYRDLFPALIGNWRTQWNQPGEPGGLTHDFPFLFVQLANFAAYPNTDWPGLREAQHAALAVAPNTAMAVAIDVGSEKDIHPKNKYDVGYRLSLAAKHVVYGRRDVVYVSPTFESMHIDGDRVKVKFSNVGDGLIVRAPPATRPSTEPAVSGTEVQGFEVAGVDGAFKPASASIVEKEHVILHSPDVPHPTAIRYAWANSPKVNLYSRQGLPAVPFRSSN